MYGSLEVDPDELPPYNVIEVAWASAHLPMADIGGDLLAYPYWVAWRDLLDVLYHAILI